MDDDLDHNFNNHDFIKNQFTSFEWCYFSGTYFLFLFLFRFLFNWKLIIKNDSEIIEIYGIKQPNHPRSDIYESFFHELITEISDVGQFSYQLRTLPEAIYGGEIGETIPQGLIGEIYENVSFFFALSMIIIIIIVIQ